MLIPHIQTMEKETLKEIIYNLERLLDKLKQEIYSDSVDYEDTNVPILDYDEIFEETNEY